MFNWNYDNYIDTLENNWIIKSQQKAKKFLCNLQWVGQFSSDTIMEAKIV